MLELDKGLGFRPVIFTDSQLRLTDGAVTRAQLYHLEFRGFRFGHSEWIFARATALGRSVPK
jgi:hypothetical protein